jgi:hypothetical protein
LGDAAKSSAYLWYFRRADNVVGTAGLDPLQKSTYLAGQTGFKSFQYILTDPRQFDILRALLAGWGIGCNLIGRNGASSLQRSAATGGPLTALPTIDNPVF